MAKTSPTSPQSSSGRDTRAHGRDSGRSTRRIDCAGPSATETRAPEPATKPERPSQEELENSHGRAARR